MHKGSWGECFVYIHLSVYKYRLIIRNVYGFFLGLTVSAVNPELYSLGQTKENTGGILLLVINGTHMALPERQIVSSTPNDFS